ncbi:GNAT family N-acetyltransferase [Patescibacteria group bacterium]
MKLRQIKLKLAENNLEEIITFFQKHLDLNSDNIASGELLCPVGIKAAIKRKQIVVCVVGEEIIAAMRFYPRKREPNTASLYQFAIDTKYRGKNLLRKMLLFTGCKTFEALCPLKSNFNNYYKKTGWFLKSQDQRNNCWNLSL